MRTPVPVLLVLAAAAACSSTTPVSPERSMPLVASAVNTGDPLGSTHLSGDHEVPPRDTDAQGQAILKVADDGLSISYTLMASNIENVVASHIHVGAPTVNGPVVVFLFGAVPPGGGRQDGILAEGTFTAANLTGPLAGQPLSALLDAIDAGNAYVNVHTNDGINPTNTGPGDFPGGEIRGQIRSKNSANQ